MTAKGESRGKGHRPKVGGAGGVGKDKTSRGPGGGARGTGGESPVPGGEGGGPDPEGQRGRRGGGLVEKPPTVDPLPAGVPAPVKKKIGRPTKETAAEKATADKAAAKEALYAKADKWSENVESFVIWGFDFLAERRGDFWKLSALESHNLSVAIARVAVKHIPEDYMDRYGEEAGLAICAGFIFWPRIQEERKLAKSGTRPDGDAGHGQDHAPAPYPQSTP